MITQTIQDQINAALKAHDAVRLSTLRMLSSAFNYERIARQHDLTEEEALEVVKREAKKRKDAIEIYKKVDEVDRAHKEQQELAILEEYLPKQMSDEELTHIVEATIHEMGVLTMADMGRAIGAVMHKVNGKADGGRVSAIIKSKLQ